MTSNYRSLIASPRTSLAVSDVDDDDGTRAPTANLFDEMWEIKEEYPFIFKVLQHAGRKGPKENSITILATHAFEDIEDVASLSKTGNVLFIGKQLGDYSKIVAHAKFSRKWR